MIGEILTALAVVGGAVVFRFGYSAGRRTEQAEQAARLEALVDEVRADREGDRDA